MQSPTTSFSHEQVVFFQQRYDKGYDLDIDLNYNLWLHQEHWKKLHSYSLKRRYSCDNLTTYQFCQ